MGPNQYQNGMGQPFGQPAASMMTMRQPGQDMIDPRYAPMQPTPQPQNSQFLQWTNNTPMQPTPISQSQPVGFPGRYISSPRDVMPKEVPLDGSVALFPTSDLQAIYLKVWNQSGQIRTIRYIVDPQQPDEPANQMADTQAEIFARLDKIEQMLKKQKGGKTDG